MPARPIIGDFRSPPNNQPRTDPPKPPIKEEATPPVEEEVTEATTEADAEAVTAAVLEDAKLTPAERYRKRLESLSIPLSEAEGIFDAVFSKGYYEEFIRLGKANRRAVFRTRQYEDTLRLQKALELERPGLGISQDDLITRYNLAASLYEWDGRALPHETDADFEAALKLVRRLPAPIYALLTNELAKFDQKTLVIFSDGAVENFL